MVFLPQVVDEICLWRIGQAEATTHGDQLPAVKSTMIHAMLDDFSNRRAMGFSIEL